MITIPFQDIKQETDFAWNIKFGDYKYIWLPKSKCNIDIIHNIITLPNWLMKKKGLL